MIKLNLGSFKHIIFTNRYITTEVCITSSNIQFCYSGFYGEPRLYPRPKFWDHFAIVHHSITLVWLVMGNLNQILSPSDKFGGADPNLCPIMHCRNILASLNLKDLSVTSHPYTWLHGNLWERLNWVLITPLWYQIFPNTTFHHLLFLPTSDHCSLLVKVDHHYHRPFNSIRRHYEHWQTLLEGYRDRISHDWHKTTLTHHTNWLNNMQNMLNHMQRWSKTNPANLKHKINVLWDQLQAAQNANNTLTIKKIQNDLDSSLVQQENYWHQRSNINWL